MAIVTRSPLFISAAASEADLIFCEYASFHDQLN